jgi:hypothetical protein
MITNFDKHTEDLTDNEAVYTEDVKRYLEFFLRDKKTPVKQTDLCDQMNFKFVSEHGPDVFYITTARLRKYFNYFRVNGVLPLIATSEGCYISREPEEIQKQIVSLEERARQIQRAADGMKKFIA